jgi:hypothetical protein
MGATIIVKNNATDLLQDLLVMKKEVTKYSNFPCGPYTVIAQYLVYQESIQEVLLKFK